MRRKAPHWLGVLAGLLALGACGEGTAVEVDPAVAPFVGAWDATAYQIWPESDPEGIIDVLVTFGAFHISVEPSGQYTAVLEATPPQIQIGQLTVIGTTIRLDVTTPTNQPSATAIYSFPSPDQIILDGEIEVDFNNDGTRDPGGSHIELQRRPIST